MKRTTGPVPPEPDFRVLFESAPGLYLVLTPDLTIVAVSNAYVSATMTKREEILGRQLFDVFPDNPDDPNATGTDNLRASLARVLTKKRPDAMAVQKYDIRKPESEGGGFEERHWSPVNSPVLRPDGTIAYIIHRVEDVTEFVRLKREGSEQSQLAEQLKTRAGQMEAEIYRRAQELQEANRQLREFQTELEERVVGRTADLQRAYDELQRQIAEREKTEQALARSEEQLRQSQKLEAIGRLAGGIAHDFNNLLTVILSYSDMLLHDLPSSDPRHGEITQIQRAGVRAADLTRQLLAFSRQQVLDPSNLDVNEILTSVNSILTRVVGEDVELRMQLGTDLGSVRVDRSQVEQVIMNLVVNARDAMPDGGRISIRTEAVELDEELAGSRLEVSPGPYVMLSVSDTGSGMDKETQARIFEPFFTTKELGKGTGLGLSTAFGIVKQSGGSIWLYSEPGAGTTFKIYLPRVADGTKAPSAKAAELPRGDETILLVEDEEQVRVVAASILRRAGYSVLAAASPGEAISIAERAEKPIDLLVTDVIMPKMNGRLLAERLVAGQPGIKVLFMSGYTDDIILHHGVLDGAVAFLQKPLTRDSLTRRVRQVLDGSPAGVSLPGSPA